MKVSFQQAKELLSSGKVVAVPTETVYGLAASLSFPKAIQNVFALKGRPAEKPLIVHIDSIDRLGDLAVSIPDSFERLKGFWPGPLTIVFDANVQTVPDEVRAGQKTVAVRLPGHDLLIKLIRETGPLAAPSANLSGTPPPTTADEVCRVFGEDLAVLDGGPCPYAQVSTLIRLRDDGWELLREGAVPAHEIKACFKA